MKRIAITLIVFIASAYILASDIDMLESYFENEQYDVLRQQVGRLAGKYPNNPTVLFFKGYSSTDPDSALFYYQQVASRFPESKYAANAHYRLGQFYYFVGDYQQARQRFSTLLRSYPSSYLKDDAQYLYCQCIMAQGKTDSAKIFLKAFVQNVRRSPYVNSAILDLESLGGLSTNAAPVSAAPKEKDFYSIRVASFKSFESAKNALFKLSNIYPHVEVSERRLGNTNYYIVYLGRFESRDKARQYAKLYIEPHLQDYEIVRRTL